MGETGFDAEDCLAIRDAGSVSGIVVLLLKLDAQFLFWQEWALHSFLAQIPKDLNACVACVAY